MRSGGRCRKIARVYDRAAREDLNRREKHHDAKDRDYGRNGSGRLRARVSDGEGWGTRPDRLARGGTCAGDGKAFARAHWRQRPDRRNGQSFSGSRVRYRCLDSSLLRRGGAAQARSEEHTSELQSHLNLVCRLLLEKKKKKSRTHWAGFEVGIT